MTYIEKMIYLIILQIAYNFSNYTLRRKYDSIKNLWKMDGSSDFLIISHNDINHDCIILFKVTRFSLRIKGHHHQLILPSNIISFVSLCHTKETCFNKQHIIIGCVHTSDVQNITNLVLSSKSFLYHNTL